MGWLFFIVALWLWACTGVAVTWLDSEVDGKNFDPKSWDDWAGAMVAPIQITWVIGSGIWHGLFDDRQD